MIKPVYKKTKNKLNGCNAEYVCEMPQLHQARRTVTTVDDQYRNQNELHVGKIISFMEKSG